MEIANATITPQLLEDALLLKRDSAIAKVNAVFDGQIQELCLRTRYPKELTSFIAACLSKRGELQKGVGERCLFVRDRESWTKLCASSSNCILIARPELDFEGARNEMLQQARAGRNATIFGLTNPRPDIPEIADLIEPSRHDVLELLKTHNFTPGEAERLAKRSNGNIHLLTQLLSGTSERRKWASGSEGYHLRALALLGGWNDGSELDQFALSELFGQPYESWVQRLYPLTHEVEPPVLLEGKVFRPVSRYETWQQLGCYLNDRDLELFEEAAKCILSESNPALELPKEQRPNAIFSQKTPTFSSILRKGIAETLTMLGGQGKSLDKCSPTLPAKIADSTVYSLLRNAKWNTWASLSEFMPLLAEASPNVFLDCLESALTPSDSPIKSVFEANDSDLIFGATYHCGLLWALEVLAWHPDYLNRVCISLARMAEFPLPHNMGNNPSATLRSIFLTWLPQTLASVDSRRIAVEKVIEESPKIGWKLLLEILPEAHQSGSYNQKPVWRDWIDSSWTEGATRSEMYRQIRGYADLAVKCAISDFKKLTELIERWDHLPPEVFQKILTFLYSPDVINRPEEERFTLWQQLIDEVQRHRRFASADWAMPEEELRNLEKAAEAIQPTRPSILNRRLFNHYGDTFYTTDNYAEESEKVAEMREQAVLNILDSEDLDRVVEMASFVKLPVELGGALARVDDPKIDAFLLPRYILSPEPSVSEMVRGYVWGRYLRASFEWVLQLDLSLWEIPQQVALFSALPFHSPVWRHAAKQLGAAIEQYWSDIWPNMYQAQADLPEAISSALDHKRPDLAISGINALRHLNRPIPTDLCVRTFRQFVENEKTIRRIPQHELIETIKYLQKTPDVDSEDMVWIEFQFLRLLDRFSGGAPVFLERKLASSPAFFHEAITICFRSEQQRDQPPQEIDPHKKKTAEHVFRLLHEWGTPPGSTKGSGFNEALLSDWMTETRRLCVESGHWPIAQQIIGHTFAFDPAGLEGMLMNPAAAKVLDSSDYGEMRTGFRLALFNERGVHGFTQGNEEFKIAKDYRGYATRYDEAGFTNIAATLRSLAESYEREAERERHRNPFQSD